MFNHSQALVSRTFDTIHFYIITVKPEGQIL